MRRYWQPVAMSVELAADKPLPATIFGEELILFRDGEGNPALIGRYCAHQGVDMIYGCVEPDGLRCMYHGWLFDNRGRVVMRGDWLPEKERRWDVGQPAYPVVESGGIVFAYLGRGEAPALPAADFFAKPKADWSIEKIERRENYLETLGQQTDPSLDKVSFVAPNMLMQQSISSASPSLLRWHVAVDDSSHVEFNLRFAGDLPFKGEPLASARQSLLARAATLRAEEQAAQSTVEKNPT
jgi:nitrite reductase/ring-hydroxylating ferredoxin subunit